MLKSYINNSSHSYNVDLSKSSKQEQIKSSKDEKDAFIKKNDNKNNKKFNNEKVGKFLYYASFATIIAFYLFKNKSSSAKKLAKHINFTPANNIDEAIKFGKKHLKIEDYVGFETENLEIINWINEGMVNVSNAQKGKIRVPKIIKYVDLSDETTIAGVVTDKNSEFFGTFVVNKKYFHDLTDELSMGEVYKEKMKGKIEFLRNNGLFIEDSELNKAYEKMQNPNSTFKEKIEFIKTTSAFSEMIDLYDERPYVIIDRLLKDGLITSEDINNKTIEQISKMGVFDQQSMLFHLTQNIQSKTGKPFVLKPNKTSAFQTIYHEMAHIQDMMPRVETIYKFDSAEKYPEELRKWLENFENTKTAYSVSEYSASGPGEFIAETYAAHLNGNKLSKDVLDLYNKLNGPKLPDLG